MPVIHLVPRDPSTTYSLSSNGTTTNIILSLFSLVILAAFVVSAVLIIRQKRRSKLAEGSKITLAERRESRHQSKHHRLTVTVSAIDNSESPKFYEEKQEFATPKSSQSPVPEIRVTFPEEYDDCGKRQSGRVLVVRVGEHTVGLEPLHENPPSYQQDGSERFDSLDFERPNKMNEKDTLI